jgi:hypothetical protein
MWSENHISEHCWTELIVSGGVLYRVLCAKISAPQKVKSLKYCA